MHTNCKCDHLFKIKEFKNGSCSCETYNRPFEYLIERYPCLRLGDLNKINDCIPIKHYPDGQENTYIEILIERR